MTRKIRTTAELDALPVWAAIRGEDFTEWVRFPAKPDVTGEWVSEHGDRATSAELEPRVYGLVVLHDPSAPAPTVVPEAAVEAAASAVRKERAFSAAAAFGVPIDDVPHCAEMIARAALTAALPLLTAAPSVVSDAAGLGDRIAALSARLAAVGFPACTCHPGDDDSERCLPSPQDWRAEIVRAALSSTTLTAAPSATRDEVARVIRCVTDRWDEPLDEVHDVPPVADALLARFTITPKEDR